MRKKRTYRKIFRRSCLHVSKWATASGFSEMRSLSRLMLCRALLRLVAAMLDSAMTTFIWSFSASRSNLRCFLDDDFLSLSFFLLLDDDDDGT